MTEQSQKKRSVLARTVREAKNYAVTMKVLTILLSCLVILTTIGYIVSILYSRFGSFTVTIDKFDNVKYGLSLSETPEFSYPVARLNARSSEDVTNIDGNQEIPADVDMINGQHNGANYIAYTFYAKNVGEVSVTCEYQVYIANVTNDVDTAVRIRLYRDGVPVTYARTASDGSGPEPGTDAFLTNYIVCRNRIDNFGIGDVTKFTVVIWLEGNDPDCTDDLIGGQIKVDMKMTIVGETDTPDTIKAPPKAFLS